MRLFVQGAFFFKMTIQFIYSSFFSFSSLICKLEQQKEKLPQKNFKETNSLDVFLPLIFQLKIQQGLFCSLSAPEKKDLYLLNFSAIGNREKRLGNSRFNNFGFLYNLIKLTLTELKVNIQKSVIFVHSKKACP